MRTVLCGILFLAATAPARAEVIVLTPWANVQVGPPAPTRVLVQTPWVTVRVGRAAPVMPPAAPVGPAFVPGEPPPVPLPIPVEVARPLTLNEFAATFKPKAGRYEVDLEHPVTHQPVKVAFALPEGTPRRVQLHRRELDFDYGRKQVSIRFLGNGEVRVRE